MRGNYIPALKGAPKVFLHFCNFLFWNHWIPKWIPGHEGQHWPVVGGICTAQSSTGQLVAVHSTTPF